MTTKNYSEMIKVLTALEKKILATHIEEYGTQSVVITMQDLTALDDAIVYIQAREIYS